MSLLTRKLLTFKPARLIAHQVQSNAALIENCGEASNRNPRNLELMRIARKPTGWHLERETREFWHQLIITKGVKNVTIQVDHIENGPVVTVSSKEWTLKKHLYSSQDSTAYLNMGRVLAQRCIESGIHHVHVSPYMPRCGKVDLLLVELEKSGIILSEPPRYVKANPWDLYRYEKPWEVTES